MSASLSHSSSAEPNLTPILDMVFQLITFFMLVINFKTAAMDLDLKLPVVGSARPVDTQGQEDLLILNINSQGQLRVYGQLISDVGSYIGHEAQASLLINKSSPATSCRALS
jgi:biopolymer transport protein ExbD